MRESGTEPAAASRDFGEDSPPERVAVLLVEDDENYRFEFEEEVVSSQKENARFDHARNLKDVLGYVDREIPDLIVLDIIFPADATSDDVEGLDYEAGIKVLDHITSHELPCKVVVLSSQSKNFAVDLLIKYPAVLDYIFKDSPWAEIRAKILRHVDSILRQKLVIGRSEMNRPIIGESEPILKVKDLIRRVARKHDTTVLITGESGTGKELVANHIHLLSGRRHGPFIVVNCAAIPEGLLESEFFGFVPGAFTGADRSAAGKLEQAHRGTLFLDEISEIPISIQVKLLRVIQNKTVQRLGDTAQKRIDVRIVAATNRNLQAAIEAGRFREDLYYRLNVLPIEVPPLSLRPGDIPILASHFLDLFNREMEEQKRLDPGAMDLLSAYRWEGNVRELRNIIERLMIISDEELINVHDVRGVLGVSTEEYAVRFPLTESDYKKVKKRVLETFNRGFLGHHLKVHGHNIVQTAKAIRYNRQDLSNLIKSLGLDEDSGHS